jgi:hypothetical protein
MKNDVFGSVDDIDAALDLQFGKVANEPEIEEEKEADNENTEETEVETTSEENNVETKPQEETGETQEEKPQNDIVDKARTQKEYAFSKLRTENSSLKKERDDYKSNSDFLESLAKDYGYDDVSKFQDAVKLARYEKEAQAKGYDPELYKKTMEQEARIKELERQREQELFDRKIEKFKEALEFASNTYGVSEDEIFNRLEGAGVSVDELLSISNPKTYLDGVLVDKIRDKAKQSQIDDIKNMKSLVEDKNEQGSAPDGITIDSLLKDDLAKYKADNFL